MVLERDTHICINCQSSFIGLDNYIYHKKQYDRHMCLQCHMNIVGLHNYIKHKQKQCSAVQQSNDAAQQSNKKSSHGTSNLERFDILHFMSDGSSETHEACIGIKQTNSNKDIDLCGHGNTMQTSQYTTTSDPEPHDESNLHLLTSVAETRSPVHVRNPDHTFSLLTTEKPLPQNQHREVNDVSESFSTDYDLQGENPDIKVENIDNGDDINSGSDDNVLSDQEGHDELLQNSQGLSVQTEDCVVTDYMAETSETGYECNVCNVLFTDKQEFDLHQVSRLHLAKAGIPSKETAVDRVKQIQPMSGIPFQCRLCQFYTVSKEEMESHQNTHNHKQQPETSIIRGIDVLPKTEAIMSKPGSCKSVTEIPYLKCPHCDYSDRRVGEFVKYVRSFHNKHNKDILKCPLCDIKIGVADDMEKHIEVSHTNIKPAQSNHANVQKKTPNKYVKRLHMTRQQTLAMQSVSRINSKVETSHRTLRKTRNATQNKRQTNKNLLNPVPKKLGHILGVKSEQNSEETNGKIYCCKECPKTFRTITQRECHELDHLVSKAEAGLCFSIEDQYAGYIEKMKDIPSTKAVKCPNCSASMTKSDLSEHLLNCSKPYRCLICSKNYSSPRALKCHLKYHLKGKQFVCQFCPKKYRRKNLLDVHLVSCHDADNKKKFTCRVCKHSFATQMQLENHVRVHRKKTLKCPEPGCGYSFVLKCHLDVHMLSHKSERTFLCDLCGWAAKTKRGLLYHSQRHAGQRNFPCPHCEYKATAKAHLERHMRCHTGAKPYKCPYCNYSSTTLTNIHKHITQGRKHAGMAIYPCKLCTMGFMNSKDFRMHLLEVHNFLENELEGRELSRHCGIYVPEVDNKRLSEGSDPIPVKSRERQTLNSEKNKTSKTVTCVKPQNAVMSVKKQTQTVVMNRMARSGPVMIRKKLDSVSDFNHTVAEFVTVAPEVVQEVEINAEGEMLHGSNNERQQFIAKAEDHTHDQNINTPAQVLFRELFAMTGTAKNQENTTIFVDNEERPYMIDSANSSGDVKDPDGPYLAAMKSNTPEGVVYMVLPVSESDDNADQKD